MAEAFLTGLGANVVSEFLKSISGAIKQHVLYVFKHRSYINDLNDQVQQLKEKRERVEMGVDSARRQGDEIYEDVGKWLKDVERFVEEEANPITGNEGQAGTCSFITLYKVGRKAVKAAEAGSNLLGKDFSNVSYRPALQRTESMYVDRDYEAFDSVESLLSEIMEALKDAEVKRIGVYGMGGVGKTTLVKKVAWQAKQDKLFDDVAMVEVTQTPDNKTIQETIAFDLGMELGQHESELVRANRIRTRLKKGKRVLVILDNIWATPGLEAIGIPWEKDHEKGASACGKEGSEGTNDEQKLYKILVTSRSIDVLRDNMNTSKNFWVKTLSNRDSWNLFRKFVGNSIEKPGFLAVGEKIVGKCGGLPLAVSAIANALKYKELSAWEVVLDKLEGSNPSSLPEMDKNVFSVIKLSFDLLDSHEAKSLLMLFSLVDAGFNLSLDYLLRYGMGLRLFQDVYKLENGRNPVEKLANDLKASCLLLQGRNKTFFQMHEVVHAVARSIASADTNKLMFNIPDVPALNRVLHDKISQNPMAISLPRRDIYELPERLECTKLEFFLLATKSRFVTIPSNFFVRVKELKVINLDHIDLMSVPLSFGYLNNLRTLCLEDCLIGDISFIGELTNLEILSFSRSNIEQLPREIGQLTRLQLLDLSQCSSLKAIPGNVISKLSQLEELDLDSSYIQWEDGYNANLAELNKLPHLTTLRICIPDAQIIPPSLFIQQLKRFKILIGDEWDWSHSIEASRTLKLKLNNMSCLGYRLIKLLLKVTDDLFLDQLKDVQNVLYEVDEEGFLNLKHLHVQNGPELLYIVNSVGQTPCDAFLMLEALSLNNLVNLVKICDGPLKEASFNKLKALKVNKCDDLKHLFSISMVKCLSQLEEIKVTHCKNLQVIFAGEDDEGHLLDDGETINKIEFTQLRSLTLKYLPQFRSFTSIMKTPLISQIEITVEDDPKDFETLFGRKIEFSNLEELVVKGCSGLKFLFSSSMIKSLMQLQKLWISKCELIEEVIDTKGLEGEATFSFPKLFNFRLYDLPKLTRFGIGNLAEFPLVNSLQISSCPNLRTFFSYFTCEITRNKPEEMNSEQSTQSLFTEKVGLPSLETLVIYQMDNLTKIWDDRLHLDSFCKLRTLLLISNNKLRNIFPSSMLGRLHTLHTLEVVSSDSVEEIFEFQALNDQKSPDIIAPQLKKLEFYGLIRLKHVWNMRANQILAFENLIELSVSYSSSLKSLFPGSIAKGLLKLEVLQISHCDMNEIIAKEERTVEETTIPRFKFPQLSSLELSFISSVESFYSKEHISEWPALKKMKVCHCSNIKILSSDLQKLDHRQPLFSVDKVAFPNLEELEVYSMDMLLHLWVGNSQPCRIFQNLGNLKVSSCQSLEKLVPPSISFWNLQTLEVSECNKLTNLVTLSTARSLVSVKRMDIAYCKMLKEIITQVGDEAINDDDRIVLNQLNYLSLHALPSLTSFCTQSYGIEFPQLEQLIIGKYTMMGIFCPGVLRTPKLHKVLSTGEYDNEEHWQGNLNTTIQWFYKELVGFRGIESLKLSELPQLKEIWHYQLPFSVFCNLRSLEVDECAHLSSAISANMLVFLNNLKDLYVRNCDSVEEILDLRKVNDDGHFGVLSQLRKLHLINLPRLKYICRSHQEILNYENLEFLEVQECGNLRYMFTLPMFSSLKNLQEMKIKNCVTMEVIITNEAEKDAEAEIVLPMLKSIILESLPELTSFYSGSSIVECSSLKTITINDCTKMEDSDENFKTLFGKKVSIPYLEKLEVYKMNPLRRIWDDQLTLNSFCKLKYLMIKDSCELTNVFPSIMLGRLQTLCSFIVSNCESLEEIFEVQALGFERTEAIVVGQLKKLHFSKLPKLKHIWNLDAQGILSFQNLLSVKVQKCGNLKSFFPASIAKGLLQLEKLEIKSCMVEEIVAKEEAVVAEKELISERLFPKLVELILKDLPKLKRFCYFTGDLVELFSLSTLEIKNCPNMETFISNSICAGLIRNEPAEINSEDNLLAHTVPLFDEKVSLPNLVELVIWKMNNLRKIWGDDQPNLDSFSKLRDMGVAYCNQLLHIFPSIMSGRLQRLKLLAVWHCDSLEEILELQALGVRDEIVFSELKDLWLVCLPRLKGFYLGNCTLKFPFLDDVCVGKCSKMETFSRGIVNSPKLQRVKLTKIEMEEETEEEEEEEAEGLEEEEAEGLEEEEAEGQEEEQNEKPYEYYWYEWCWEGDLNTTSQQIFKKMNAQTSEQE